MSHPQRKNNGENVHYYFPLFVHFNIDIYSRKKKYTISSTFLEEISNKKRTDQTSILLVILKIFFIQRHLRHAHS